MSSQIPTHEYATKMIAWIKALYASKNSGEALLSVLSDVVEIHFNNLRSVRDKHHLAKLIHWEFEACRSITYKVEDIRVFNDEILIATTQTYNTKAGKQFVVRVFTVVYKTPEQTKISRFDIYADIHDVFEYLKTHHGHHGLD